MISIFVVEDEALILESTLSMLQELPVSLKGSATNVDDAFAGISKTQPDLVLLDVEIGSQTSFDLLEKFPAIDFKIIFVTAHQKYALDAFKFSAIDFLLKPLRTLTLETAIKKAEESIQKEQAISLQTLRYNLQATPQDQKIILKTQSKIYVLKLEEIVHCEADQSYTIFYTSQGKVVVSKAIGYFDDLLVAFDFYRVHKSYLINLKHIVQIHKADGGEVELSNASRVPISQRKREEFLLRIDSLGLH